MKYILILPLLVCFSLHGQTLEEFNLARNKTDKSLMLTLGSWAAANFIVSGVGWATAEVKEAKYFHEMNVMWNTVNLGIAIPGIIKAYRAKSNLTLAETIREEHKTEKIFLFNSVLDMGYLATGFVLRSEAKSNADRNALFNGYGNSLIMQGGFLLLFDLTGYFVHNAQSNKKLQKFIDKIEPSTNGIGLRFNLD